MTSHQLAEILLQHPDRVVHIAHWLDDPNGVFPYEAFQDASVVRQITTQGEGILLSWDTDLTVDEVLHRD